MPVTRIAAAVAAHEATAAWWVVAASIIETKLLEALAAAIDERLTIAVEV